MPKFNYEKAKSAGYSDEEISQFLASQNPNFNYQKALQSGYSPAEINNFLANQDINPPKERSALEKGARIGQQFGIGLAENALLPYEIAVAPLASKDAQTVAYRETLEEDLERLLEQKQTGVWDEQDQQLLDSIIGQIKSVSESQKNVQTADIGVRGLVEKITGQDLQPEGILEKSASIAGLIKNPKNAKELLKLGITPKSAVKAILPSGKETFRALGAGLASQTAEEADFGPIGSLALMVTGDLLGGGIYSGAKALKNPKKALAEVVAAFTPKDKKAFLKEVMEDFKKSGIKADLGTITDNNLIKWIQARLAQSGLTGNALKKFKTELTDQIKKQYKTLEEGLSEAKFATRQEAAETSKNALKDIRDKDLSEVRNLYADARNSLKDDAFVIPKKLVDSINEIEKALKPGQLKSGEQKIVLDALETLKRDVTDTMGRPIGASVKDLMNSKDAINDLINYEAQGGAKQLLKRIVGDLDRAIISHGKENPRFAKNYIKANKKFSEHAKTFRNREINRLLQDVSPEEVLNKMNTVFGIRRLKAVLEKTKEGREIFQKLKRQKLEEIIGNNLVDSTSQQVKLGTFSKLLEKGKNKDLVLELLGPKDFKKLELLQKNAGRLAESANKFYNSSQSGTTAVDAAAITKLFYDGFHLLTGNPWPLAKSVSVYAGIRALSSLIVNPEFLKLVEGAVVADKSKNVVKLDQIFERMKPLLVQLLESEKESI